jgi:nicotinamide-nucleotide adenylyltransferase
MKPTQRFNFMCGRFQPFHHGHLNFLRIVIRRPEPFIVGITNPDPTVVKAEGESSHRHLADANPFTYFERHMMVREVLRDEEVRSNRYIIIPFAVNKPEVWRHYVPEKMTAYVPVFSEAEDSNAAWQLRKIERLKEQGHEIQIIDDISKRLHATDVRERILKGENWEELCPPGVCRVLRELVGSGRFNM